VAAAAVRGALDLIAKEGGGVVEGYPHDLQGEKMRSQFLYSATRTLFEELGFSYERPKGKKNCVMREKVSPVKTSRRARVGRRARRPDQSTLLRVGGVASDRDGKDRRQRERLARRSRPGPGR